MALLTMQHTALTLQTAPASEPISTSDAKHHLRVDTSADDSYIDTLVIVARRTAERITNHALITQTWELVLDDWPSVPLELPKPPLQQIDQITYTDEDGNSSTLSSSKYLVDTDSIPGRLTLKDDEDWPTDTLQELAAVRIRFTAGFGSAASDVPEDIIKAMELLVGHWYENREDITLNQTPQSIPFGVRSLLADYRQQARNF